MKVVNLTAHEVTLLESDGISVRKVFEPSGHVARLSKSFDLHGFIEDIDVDIEVVRPISSLNFDGAIIEPYTIYIVSWLFLQALRDAKHPNLHQFVAPNTEGAPKDFKGAVKGVQNFIVLNS